MKKKSVQSIDPCASEIQTIYDIIKAHGGTIIVKSTENKGLPSGQAGTEFTIELPI